MQRVLTPELMDDPRVPEPELRSALGYLRFVNRFLGGSRALLRHLAPWSRRWPRDRPVTLLDLGTGSADVPLTACRWARARGIELRVTAIDTHEATLRVARERAAGEPWVRIEACDARGAIAKFGDGSFDYVHAGLFLHHLSDADVLIVLTDMGRLCRAGLVWNDLRRSALHRVLVAAAVIGQRRIARHDAKVSVEAGFTREEVERLATEASVPWARIHAGPLFYRFTLAGERPGAWG